jgi:protocatechuate 3,4-dioxygenase alpha subunit
MVQKLDTSGRNPSQTAGPYVHIGCIPTFAGVRASIPRTLASARSGTARRARRSRSRGRSSTARAGRSSDAMLESWQADAAGVFPGQDGADPPSPASAGSPPMARAGEFTLHTVKPGRVALRDGRMQAPHIALWLVARGINIGLQTRIYFEDEDNADDPLLSRIEQRPRAATLIAARTAPGSTASTSACRARARRCSSTSDRRAQEWGLRRTRSSGPPAPRSRSG